MLYKKYFKSFSKEIAQKLNLEDQLEFGTFIKDLDKKMTIGHDEHGDGVFTKHPDEIIAEMKMEAIDLSGWGLVVWVILNELIQKSPSTQMDCEEFKVKVMEYACQGFEP